MAVKDIKEEARKKLALNMHQAVIVYTVEFTLAITLVALIVMSCVGLNALPPAAIVMLCYGLLLLFIAVVGIGTINFCLVDFYLATYRCKPYNIRRLGETLARNNVTKIFLLNLQRTFFGFLLLLCLIVPGVIYLIRTSMANYLLIANPKMTAKTALSASNKVMSGKTGAYFTLCMSLLGWYIIGVLTLGLGFIFILPYTNLIKAVYYKRNLQGDKTVYVVPPQPVSPQPEQPVQTVTVQQPQPVQPPPQPVAQPAPPPAPPVTPEPIVMPIDTLEDDDLRSMNDAMRGFTENPATADTVPEVPIMPVAAKRKTQNVAPSQAAAASVEAKPISHSVDGTSLVETERVLTTMEIDNSEAARQQAIDAMYAHSSPKTSPIRDYFSGESSSQRPDDFVTGEFVTETESEPVAEAVTEPMISDDEFDAFLREFDKETSEEPPVQEPAPSPARHAAPPRRSVSGEQPSRAVPERNRSSAVPERSQSRRTAERNARSADRNREIQERAERLKREREERLNRLNKK